MSAVLRLALAVREADGKLLVDEAVLDALPRFSGAAAEILRRAHFAGRGVRAGARSAEHPAPGRPGAAQLPDLRGVGNPPPVRGVPAMGSPRQP
jgi:hypothetical protein